MISSHLSASSGARPSGGRRRAPEFLRSPAGMPSGGGENDVGDGEAIAGPAGTGDVRAAGIGEGVVVGGRESREAGGTVTGAATGAGGDRDGAAGGGDGCWRGGSGDRGGTDDRGGRVLGGTDGGAFGCGRRTSTCFVKSNVYARSCPCRSDSPLVDTNSATGIGRTRRSSAAARWSLPSPSRPRSAPRPRRIADAAMPASPSSTCAHGGFSCTIGHSIGSRSNPRWPSTPQP